MNSRSPRPDGFELRPRQRFDAPWLRTSVGRTFSFLSPTTWTTLSLLFATLLPPFVVAYANHRGAVRDPTETVIRRWAFRAEPLLILGAAALINPVSRTASYVPLLLAIALMVATVVQTIVQVFVHADDTT